MEDNLHFSTYDIDLANMSAKELVIYLDQTLPHRCVLSTETMEMAQRYAGKRDLIDGLINAVLVTDD